MFRRIEKSHLELRVENLNKPEVQVLKDYEGGNLFSSRARSDGRLRLISIRNLTGGARPAQTGPGESGTNH